MSQNSYSLTRRLGERRVFRDDYLMLDTARRWDVITRNGVVTLTRSQWKLLFYLCKHAGAAVARVNLADALTDHIDAAAVKEVDWHIYGLRQKIGAGAPIVTIRGFGYMYDPYFERG